MSHCSPRRANRRGSSAIEFALLMPVLLAILGGILEYGWFFYQQSALMDAARVAVRAGGMTETDPEGTAVEALKAEAEVLGIPTDSADLTAVLEPSGEANILILSGTVPYQPLLGAVATPTVLNVRIGMVHEFPP